MSVRAAYMFEDYVTNILEEAGYLVEQNQKIGDGSRDIDIIAKKDAKTYCVEVKFSKITGHTCDEICSIAKTRKMIPMLVVACLIEEKRKQYFKQKYPQLILEDITNLLFAVKDRTELYNELVSILPYPVDNIEIEEGFIRFESFQHDDYTNSLIREMELCKAGRQTYAEYENLCCKLLKNIFSEDLTLWRQQQNSNNDLYRFDLLCRIKDENQKSFWSIIERYFNSKYVIFEFKNYNNPITQKEIYTTEKYLYAKALRRVAIIISAKGYDKNAYWAAKGSLGESGKLIILLDTEDLITMNKMKLNQENPTDYLLDVLDDLLLDLEK